MRLPSAAKASLAVAQGHTTRASPSARNRVTTTITTTITRRTAASGERHLWTAGCRNRAREPDVGGHQWTRRTAADGRDSDSLGGASPNLGESHPRAGHGAVESGHNSARALRI